MSLYDRVSTAKAGFHSQNPPLPEGFYPALVLDKVEVFKSTDPKTPGVVYWKGTVVVLEPANGVKAGTAADIMIQLAGHMYDSHAVRDIGVLKATAATIFGIDPADEARVQANVTAQTLAALEHPSQPFRGHVISARVSHKQGKHGPIAKYETGVVLENGQPRRVSMAALPVALVSAPVALAGGYSPPPAASLPPPPPPAAVSFPPSGWVQHAQDPGSFYKPGPGAVSIRESDLRALMASGQA